MGEFQYPLHVESLQPSSALIWELDQKLSQDEWLKWRDSIQNQDEQRSEAAKAWCISSHWNEHTPNLEDWKIVSGDLQQCALTASDLSWMAAAAARPICIPLIPFFEDEQLADLIHGLNDPEAVAVLANQVYSSDSMMTIGPSGGLRFCWARMKDALKEQLEFQAWRWLLDNQGDESIEWPSDSGFDALSRFPGEGSRDGLERLQVAVLEGLDRGDRSLEIKRITDRLLPLNGVFPLACPEDEVSFLEDGNHREPSGAGEQPSELVDGSIIQTTGLPIEFAKSFVSRTANGMQLRFVAIGANVSESELFLFYPGTKNQRATFWYSNKEGASYFFAAASQEGMARAVLGSRKDADKTPAIIDDLAKKGGILFAAKVGYNSLYCLSFEVFPVEGYTPPTEIALFGPGGKVAFQPLGLDEMEIPDGVRVLVPVDRKAQQELNATVFHLQGLPEEVRTAMLHTLSGSGLTPEALDAQPPAAAKKFAMPVWLQILLALLVVVLLGSTAYLAHLQFSPQKIKIQQPIDFLKKPLIDLNRALRGAKDPGLNSLYAIYVEPFGGDAVVTPASQTTEAWMLTKLFLFQKDASTNTIWNSDSNAKAEAASSKLEQNKLNEIYAVACLQRPASPSFAELHCKDVSWNQAAQDIEALAGQIIQAPAPAQAPAQLPPSPSTSTPAPATGKK